MKSVRETCPICFKQHIRAARKYFYELWKDTAYFDYEADPHFDGFMEELEHAEQQCPFEQLFPKVREVKKFFEDVDSIEEFEDVCRDRNWWEWLTEILVEARELCHIEKMTQPPEPTATRWRDENDDANA